MRTLAAAILMVGSVANAAQPTQAELAAEITDNVSTEYVECAAYFSMVQGALTNSGNQALAKKYKEFSDKAAEFGLIAAQQSRSEEMATKVTLARFESSLKDMQKTIELNYSNMSLLTVKYADSCVEAMTNSEVMMKRWTEKISSKYQKSSTK